MRLRVRIERNALPATQTLWPIKDDKTTVAQFLHSINGVFPLEGDTWGLEDYRVTVGEYECLHYHELGEVCKDEDEVVIRPLQYAEVRARTLSGRDQISADGRHLVDGVPFGRPCLRAPVRPEVSIPPLKKRKLLEIGKPLENGQAIADGEPLLLTEQGEEIDFGNRDDEDEDIDAEESSDDSVSDEPSSNESASDESATDSEDDDSDGSAMGGNDTTSESSDSDDTSSSDSDRSWDGVPNSTPVKSVSMTSTSLINGTTSDDSRSHPTGSKRKRELDEEDQEHENDGERKKVTRDKSVPGAGDNETKRRNGRRRDAKKLRYLKEMQVLPQNTALRDFKDWERANPSWTMGAKTDGLEKLANQSTTPSKSNTNGSAPDTEEGDNEPPQELSLKGHSTLPPSEVITETSKVRTDENVPVVPQPERRARIDLAASRRLLLGGLGVKVPKTQEERDRVQKKLAERPKRNTSSLLGLIDSPMNGTTTAAGAAEQNKDTNIEEDTRHWRDKLNLTAVECCKDGVTYSAPPFPFIQRWDPQQSVQCWYPRHKKKKAKKSSMYSSRGRGQRDSLEYVESYDKYNIEGTGDALSYDDPVDEENGYWEDGEQEDDKDDGFPPLPDNLEDLRVLKATQARKGDYIAYEELTCDASTEWQPKTVIRSAMIAEAPENGQDQGWCLQLSSRDIKRKVFDEEGNRVYDKFEMPDDDDAEDYGAREVAWSELGTARLLLRRQGVDSGVDEGVM